MKATAIGICAACVVLAASIDTAAADDPITTMSVGYSSTSGKYGSTTTTTIQSMPFVGTVDYGDLSLTFSVPMLEIHGDPDVIPGFGKVSNTNPKKRANGGAMGSAAGIGDIVVSATYDFYTNADEDFGLDATGSVKLPNADSSRGLGDGATDYTLELGTFKAIGPVMLLGSVAFTALGATPYIKLKKHVVGYSLGGLFTASDNWSFGANFEAGSQSIPGPRSAATRELTAFAVWRLSHGWKLQVHTLKGFSNGSPDTGAGAALRRSF